ncbi:MAG: nucleotide sugar dehydrogenase [Chitinophagaceae bacterium]
MIKNSTLKKSVSPVTGKEYIIPDSPADQRGIEAFIEKNHGKKVVVVQGLGFVGAVMSLVVANALTEEYAVIGIDLPSTSSYWKIMGINEGIFPVVADDPKIDLFFRAAIRKGNLYATFDPFAYSKADIIIVDINLDVQKQSDANGRLEHYDVNLDPFRNAMGDIGSFCKPDVLVLVETTVPPGTCRKVVKPILEEHLEKRGLQTGRLRIGHSYERVMPGPKYIDSIQNFFRVFSGIDEESATATETFLRTIIRTDEYPLTRLGNTQATEMAKVLENSYRAMNIAFIVEWSRFAEEAGVDLYEMVQAIRLRPTHRNIMLPGIGVGGYCLTKDPLLASWAKLNLYNSDEALLQSETAVSINDRMPLYAFEFLERQYNMDLRDKSVLLLGVSYLNDVGDTRYSPVEAFYERLLNVGARVSLQDPHIYYWEEKKELVNQDLHSALKGSYDIIIISTGHKEYRTDSFIDKLLNLPASLVYDTIGVLNKGQIARLQVKHTVRVLGRGDIS